jgi:hypothetical protein
MPHPGLRFAGCMNGVPGGVRASGTARWRHATWLLGFRLGLDVRGGDHEILPRKIQGFAFGIVNVDLESWLIVRRFESGAPRHDFTQT